MVQKTIREAKFELFECETCKRQFSKHQHALECESVHKQKTCSHLDCTYNYEHEGSYSESYSLLNIFRECIDCGFKESRYLKPRPLDELEIEELFTSNVKTYEIKRPLMGE